MSATKRSVVAEGLGYVVNDRVLELFSSYLGSKDSLNKDSG